MNDHQSFQQLAALITILSVPYYLISVLLLPVLNDDFSPEVFSGACQCRWIEPYREDG